MARLHRLAAALILVVMWQESVLGARDTKTADLSADKGAAAAGAREGRELARAEGVSAGALNRREKREERRLEAELASPTRVSISGSNSLTPAERKADSRESKLVDQAERAEASAEHAEKKAEKMLKASGVQGGQKQEERETAAVLKAAEKAEKAENRAAAEEKRISQSTEREIKMERKEEREVKAATADADKVNKYRQETRRDDDQVALAKGIEKQALAKANREQRELQGNLVGVESRGSEKAASNERLAVDMAARAESKKKEGNQALLKEAEAVVKAEKDVGKLKREEAKEEAMNGGRPGKRMGKPMTPAKMQKQAQCMGECLRDCREDCSDPEIDGADKKSKPGECGAACDKNCLEECEDERNDEVTDGRPVPRDEEEDEPPKWNAGDDEDEDEPSDGSGKGVQQATPPVKRKMDNMCLGQCKKVCDGECEVDPRDAGQMPSPAMAGRGPVQCMKDCVARCEDDCYIDEGGMIPDDPDRHRMPPDDEEDNGQDSMDVMAMDPRDRQMHQMLEGCVGSCENNCMGKCLTKAGLGMLPPHDLDREELEGMRDKSGGRLPPGAVKGHLFCSEGCSGDCFKLCERQVSMQLSGGQGRGQGRPVDAAVEGGRRAMQGERDGGRGAGRGRDAPGKNTVVLPAKLHSDGMLFGSTTWQIALALICVTTVALGAWSGRRMCMGKSRIRGAAMSSV